MGPEGVPFAKDGAAAKRPSPDKPVGKDTKKGKLQGLLPTASGRHLLLHAGRLLKDHFWPIVIIYAAKDSLSFVLHRLSQRLTNAAAEGLFGTSIPAAANPWWLYLESNFLESNVGYQACIVAFFLLALPLNILLSSLAASNTAIVCSPELTGMQGGSPSTRSSSGGGSSKDTSSKDTESRSSDRGNESDKSQSEKGGSRKPMGENERGAEQRPMQAESSSMSDGAPRHGEGSSDIGGASASRAAGPSTQQQVCDGVDGSVKSNTAVEGLWQAGGDQRSSGSKEGGHAEQSSIAAQSGPAGTLNGSAAAQEGSETEGGHEEHSTAAQAGPAGTVNAESTQQQGQQQQQQQQGPGLKQSIKDGLQEVKASLPAALAMLRRVWIVDLLFNLRALPLQGLSLLVLPVFWTVPRLLAIQLAVPVAIMEGRSGNDALARSSRLMDGFRSSYGWPFVALILAVRFVDGVRNAALTALPSRWWQEVIEMPILLTAIFSFTKLLLIRLQDLIPLAAYMYALKLNEEERQGSSQGASEQTSQGSTQ